MSKLKTIREYLLQLPDGYGEYLMSRNSETYNLDMLIDSIQNAILNFGPWDNGEFGDFCLALFHHYDAPKFYPLPKLPTKGIDLPALQLKIDDLIDNTTDEEWQAIIDKRKKYTFAEVTSMLREEGFFLEGDSFYNSDSDIRYCLKDNGDFWAVFCEGYILPKDFDEALIHLMSAMTACELLNSTR